MTIIMIKALTYELEHARQDIKKAIEMSDDRTAVHHLYKTVKSIEKMLVASHKEIETLEELE